MSRFKRIPSEIREEILRRIKEGGEPAHRVATETGVSPKTVYNWLAKQSEKSGVSWLEHNRLKRENEQLKAIVGELTLDMKRTKKI
jgi:transposase-like protein